jgi:hypothetical protein
MGLGRDDSDLTGIGDGRGQIFDPNVIPAKAGIHRSAYRTVDRWIPAFAGMTVISG